VDFVEGSAGFAQDGRKLAARSIPENAGSGEGVSLMVWNREVGAESQCLKFVILGERYS